MHLLVIVRQSQTAQKVHTSIIKTLDSFVATKGNKVVSIFFTQRAVPLASEDAKQIQSVKDIQKMYIEFSQRNKVDLLVCGREYAETGLNKNLVNPAFVLSGNMELSLFVNAADKVLEV